MESIKAFVPHGTPDPSEDSDYRPAKAHARNFATLRKAFKYDHVALLECTHKLTRERVAVLCAVSFNKDNATFTPFAFMPNGDPFEMFEPAGSVTEADPSETSVVLKPVDSDIEVMQVRREALDTIMYAHIQIQKLVDANSASMDEDSFTELSAMSQKLARGVEELMSVS